MCGIAGVLGRGAEDAARGLDASAESILAHRGPDGFGRWDEDGVSLLHWRLAVIDLSTAGNQPMASSDGRYVLSYNGEVYNFEELRAELDRESLGRSWRGHSDSEVIVEGFARWGQGVLGRLHGMFALAVFDRLTRTLVLARDRSGIKPLYVWRGAESLLFASEAKFFFRERGFAPAIDPAGLSAFFRYGHAYDDRHVLAGVRQLEPGEILVCTPGSEGAAPIVRSGRLCPKAAFRPVQRSDAEAAAELRRLLGAAVERQLVADVPLGVLLSGGVDSSILTALAARAQGADRTMAFTLGYPGMGTDFDEIAQARRVARHLGVEHHVYEASADDLVRVIDQLVWHYDEPFADAAALNVFLLSRLIRSKVTVALAGEGSDELFGGYRRYHLEKLLQSAGPVGAGAARVLSRAHLHRLPGLPRRLRIFLGALAAPSAAARYSSYLESSPSTREILRPEWRREIGVHEAIADGYPDRERGGAVGALCLADQRFWLPTTYLEKSDKGAMAHGLELRVPYLDDDVVAFANTLPDHQRIRGRARKWLLREAFGPMLPREVFSRFKRGFGVPMARWLRRELRDHYVDRVLAPDARVRRFVDAARVEACFREHEQGARDHSGLLWQLLVLEVWLRHYERGFDRPAAAETQLRLAT